MDCLECKKLVEAFESRLSQYIEARSAAYYRVSTELAAKKNVDMERAKSDLEEHQLVCVSSVEVRHFGPRASSTLRTGGMETFKLPNLRLRADPSRLNSFLVLSPMNLAYRFFQKRG
jgi:hypothetical protein